MNGVKSEIRPGVWRLRVYAGRRANGTPIQISKTFVSPEATKGRARLPIDRDSPLGPGTA